MNKMLIILSFVLLTSCGPKDVPYKNLVTRQGITYEINAETPFTGSGVWYWSDNQLASKQNYKDGEPEGLWEHYYKNGQLKDNGNFKDGVWEGLWEYYYENGQVQANYNFKEGLRDGLLERYYENGQLESKDCYKNNEKTDMSYCEK
jgi:antitoxin component YwqK of YwqJK toxin-antitoxin module